MDLNEKATTSCSIQKPIRGKLRLMKKLMGALKLGTLHLCVWTLLNLLQKEIKPYVVVDKTFDEFRGCGGRGGGDAGPKECCF